jgi:hypothetical protein
MWCKIRINPQGCPSFGMIQLEISSPIGDEEMGGKKVGALLNQTQGFPAFALS